MGVLGAKKRPQGTFDALMKFKDAGLVAADAAATVAGAAKVVDLGTGLFKGCMILDVSAIETDSSDEKYEIYVQLSSKSDFADTIVTAAGIELGHATALLGDVSSKTGRYKVYFDNEYQGTYYRYARVYTDVTGTIATGINFTAYCVPIQ